MTFGRATGEEKFESELLVSYSYQAVWLIYIRNIKIMKNFLAVVSLFVLTSTAAFAQDLKPANTPQAYQIGPGDTIEGKVLGEEDFNFKVTIDENGIFRLPYVNDNIEAQCRTENEITDEVRERYSKLLREPMLSVRVIERRPPTPVTVSGEVRAPQRVEMMREARLLELISFSGGFTEDAGGTVQIFRTQIERCADEEGKKEWAAETNNGTEVPSRMFSRSSIKEAGNESNPVIYPGDIIIVDKAAPVYLTGEVMQPTGVYIKEGGLSLTQAIAMVGGTREKAKTKDIKIYRLKGSNQRDRETISINLDEIQNGNVQDLMLAPYDIIEIDKSKDSLATTILKIVTGASRTAVSSLATSGGNRILY